MRYARYNIRNTKSGPRVTPQDAYRRSHQSRMNAGSALILAVVLTSLLAIVGVLFVMMARVNKIASSGLSENKELDSAIETVIAKISDELVLDVPGVSATNQDYYDYPDVNNAWLASLEPYLFDDNGTPADTSDDIYKWRQISDVYNKFDSNALQATIVPDYQEPAKVGDSNNTNSYRADADGDGVADSKWVELADIASSKGKPIYAAIRIIDNGGMLNVNTAYKFDPTESLERIDGSSQMQINLMALAGRPPYIPTESEERDLREARAGGEDPNDIARYETDVIWQYGNPAGLYTPFDISDELELRYRFLVNHEDIRTRIEQLWTWSFNSPTELNTPVTSGGIELDRWFYRAQHDVVGPNDIYSYRHIATTYNMDRIINANGEKMLNINTVSAADYNTIKEAFTDSNFADANGVAAQITANLIDYVDGLDYPTSDSRYDPDNNITVVYDDANIPYYGFERPCIYISELVHRFQEDAGDPNIVYMSYAIELYKPYFEDNDPCDWQLVIDGGTPITISSWTGGEQFCVIQNEDSNAPLPAIDAGAAVQAAVLDFNEGDVIKLQRLVDDVNYVVVDSKRVPDANGGWLAIDGSAHSIQRDITLHKCIRRLWDSAEKTPTLGQHNSFEWPPDSVYIQAHPANKAFTNVGEIGMVLRKSAYSEGPNTIGQTDTEADVRINFAEPEFRQIFNYLTVFDPAVYPWNNPNETRIKGRININTAPWYVIAQLPWVSQRKTFSTYELAKEIVGYRDEVGSFESIGQLCQVGIYDSNDYLGIDYYSRDDVDQAGFPDLDLPSPDGAKDDFEERDVIFARISNLVTVRSDVFTAYILVRIGTDGPQKRVVAIFDRSNVYYDPIGMKEAGKMRILAVHPVADPR